MRPQHYIPRRVSEIKSSDAKIALIGKVQNSSGSTLVVEDETGQTEIFVEQSVEVGSIVRLFCTSINGRLKADAVQSLNGFDSNLYKKTNELYRRAGI